MTDEPTHPTDPHAKIPPWASLRYRSYRNLFLLSLFVTTALQMRQAQNFYEVYELSGSALQLGINGLFQGLPLVVFGLFGGTLVDFVDRRKLLLITTGGNLSVAVALGALILTGAIQVWHIYVGTALTSVLNIVLNPTRMAMIAPLVPRSHLTNAVSLNSSLTQSAFFTGPMLAGLSLAWMHAGNAYLFNALLYLPALVAIFLIGATGDPERARERFSWLSVVGGVRFLFSQPIVLALVMLDFVITGVGFFRPLLPIFAKDILHVGPAGFGVLSSAPAIGGLLGTAYMLSVGDVKHKGKVALGAFLGYAVALGLFALSTWFWLSLLFLAAAGLANVMQAIIRQSAFHLLAPEHLRGRAFSVFNIFSQGADSVGAAEVGFAAAWLGAPGALLLGSAAGALVTLGCWGLWPGLRGFRSDQAAGDDPAGRRGTAAGQRIRPGR